jgi:coniferyl-aldehyde dehydrogenase
VSDLARLFDAQRAAFARERYPSLAVRRDRLARLKDFVTRHEARFVDAIDRDFGGRSSHETRLAELYIVAAEIADAHKHLARWMRPQRVATPIHLKPARARIERQPVGVVGVISPWNYPVQLALAPVAGALAAGNRVLLKPSELTPATSALLHELAAKRSRRRSSRSCWAMHRWARPSRARRSIICSSPGRRPSVAPLRAPPRRT